jgi:hypothetical protein
MFVYQIPKELFLKATQWFILSHSFSTFQFQVKRATLVLVHSDHVFLFQTQLLECVSDSAEDTENTVLRLPIKSAFLILIIVLHWLTHCTLHSTNLISMGDQRELFLSNKINGLYYYSDKISSFLATIKRKHFSLLVSTKGNIMSNYKGLLYVYSICFSDILYLRLELASYTWKFNFYALHSCTIEIYSHILKHVWK